MRSLLFFCSILFFAACDKSEDPQPIADCGPEIVTVSSILVPGQENFAVVESSVTGLCLSLTLEATGCSTDGWTAELYTFGEVAESLPTQTSGFLVFNTNVPSGSAICQAQLSKTFSFDLTPYVADALPTIFRIDEQPVEVTIE